MDINQTIEKVTGQYTQDRYAMYLRKSRMDMELEAMGEGETLARHRHILENLAAKHDIHPDQIDVFHELVSGESLEDRPEAQKLLSNVYQNKYKGVLVVEVERLARGNTKDQGEVADAFQASGAKIITPAKVYDPHNEFDQEYFEFGLFMSRREYKTIKRRLDAGKLQSVLEGNYVPSKRPFGYDIVKPSKKERTRVPNDEAKYVKMIFDWYTVDRWSTWKIAGTLTRMGVKTMSGKEWNRGTVRDILSNIHYTGKVSWNKTKVVKEFDPNLGKMVKRKIYTGPDEWIVVEGKHPALISQEQYDQAQIEQQVKAPLNKTRELRNPLAGLMLCKDCKRKMHIQYYPDGSRVPRYYHPGNVTCKKKSLPISDVIDALVDALKGYIKDFESKAENNHGQDELKRYEATITAMEKELASRERKRKNLFADYEDGVYTREEFIERKQHRNHAIESIKKQLQEAMAAKPEPVDYSAQIINLHKMIDCIRDPEMSADAKNVFLKQFIDHIDYDATNHGRGLGGQVILDVYLK